MANQIKKLWALELNISREAAMKGLPDADDYWVIHSEEDGADPRRMYLCVYETREEAVREAELCDHDARVVPFVRGKPGRVIRNAR